MNLNFISDLVSSKNEVSQKKKLTIPLSSLCFFIKINKKLILFNQINGSVALF